jgi:hypothetical protein
MSSHITASVLRSTRAFETNCEPSCVQLDIEAGGYRDLLRSLRHVGSDNPSRIAGSYSGLLTCCPYLQRAIAYLHQRITTWVYRDTQAVSTHSP